MFWLCFKNFCVKVCWNFVLVELISLIVLFFIIICRLEIVKLGLLVSFCKVYCCNLGCVDVFDVKILVFVFIFVV